MTDPEFDQNPSISMQDQLYEEEIIKNNVANIENRIEQKLKEIDKMMISPPDNKLKIPDLQI